MNEVGRNDPCPCGSGRRYKQCCGRFEETGTRAARANEASDSSDVRALNALASVFLGKGEVGKAFNASKRSLQIRETFEAKALIARCIVNLPGVGDDADLRRLVIRAMSESWCRPSDLVAVSAALINADPRLKRCIDRAAIVWPRRLPRQELFGSTGLVPPGDEALLRCLLENAPACGVALERFLTMARRCLLDAANASSSDALEEQAVGFYCALARQCFINEYVYSFTDDEFVEAVALRDELVAALESGNGISALRVIAVAAYFPLHSLRGVEALTVRSWPGPMTALLEQQVLEPLKEREYRGGIRRLTAVDDRISRLVRGQYEENPYPRWVKTQRGVQPVSLDAFMARQFLLPPSRFLGDRDVVDILVAGCGTGQQSIETAQRFRGSRVLAVDLSLSSLCYAMRKTQELGLGNIEYAQGDILKLGSIGRMFDLIECVGVLHHLTDPVAGWRELLSLLRPRGFMHLGFYSELARRDIVAAQRFAAGKRYGPDAQGIRWCRQDLIAADAGRQFEQITTIADFYVTSGCRDLLFHVKEHRFTLPEIRKHLGDLGLSLVGFNLELSVLRAYGERFPNDGAMMNLDHWDTFETEHRDTFIAMYNFYAQKMG